MKMIAPVFALVMATIASSAHAQGSVDAGAFPVRPITIVVPYPAGGATDFAARVIAEPAARLLGQRVVIENRPGASGALGALGVARARPDGHTLLYTNNGLLIASLLNKEIGFDPLRSFVPISTVLKLPLVLVVNKEVPVKNLAEFVKYAKDRPGVLNYATAGTTTYGNLMVNLLSQKAGILMTQVSYKGETEATMGVRTGEAHVALMGPSRGLLNFVADGSIKGVAVASSGPSEIIPGLSPIADVLPGYAAEPWFGLLGPAGIPDSIVQKLNAAVQTVLRDADVRQKIVSIGAVPGSSTSDEFARTMRADYELAAAIIQKNNIKAE